MDRVSPQKRSEVMASVKSKRTKLENSLAQKLEENGVGYFERNMSELAGRPDFVYQDEKIVIFVDSCFWHGCKQHLRMPASHQEYWMAKITRNRHKDRQVTAQLKEQGWLVLRIWEHALKNPRALKWWLTRVKNLVSAKSDDHLWRECAVLSKTRL